MRDMTTEQISENYRTRDGNMSTRKIWIAYPAWVASYADDSERASHAYGFGRTQAAAVAAAQAFMADSPQ